MKRILILALVFAISACKKNGTGGDATIVAFPEHHGKPIKGSTVYVKFKAKDLPSDPTNNYDLKVQGEEKEDHVHIEHLRAGNYYLYAVGYDSSIAETVKGGLAVTIKWKERKEERDVKVAVTE